MEEFSNTPVPRLRLQESLIYDAQKSIDHEVNSLPNNIRRSTEPALPSPRSPVSSPAIPFRPRNTSPLSRGHVRSRSSASALAPPMSRTQSMPGVNGSGHLLISTQLKRPSSPLGSPSRVRTPRKPADEVFPGLPNRGLVDISETGALPLEDSAAKPTERSSSPSLSPYQSSGISRNHRPASPLRYTSVPYVATSLSTPSTPSSVTSSPLYQNSKFDSFLGTSSSSGTFSYPGSFASSSVPSTPTSLRSRSPSISSLETIPDSPDAEEAALEAERIAQLKADADAADGGMDSKKAPEVPLGRGRTLGIGLGARDKRKRWSVCGAERRGDLNLDTIWED
jgi:hypothetical protein